MASKLILGSLVSAIMLASITATVFSIGLGYLFQPVQGAWYDSIPGISAVKKAAEGLVDKAIDKVVPGPLKEVVKSQVGNILPDPGKQLSDPTSIIDKVAPGSGAAKNLVKDKLTDEISRLASDPARAIDPLTGNIFGDSRQVIGNLRNYADEFGNRVDKSGSIIDSLGKIVGKLPSTSTVLDPSSIVSNGQIKNGFGKILGALGSYKDEAGNTVDSSGNVKNSLGQIIAKITSTGIVSTGQGGSSLGQKITSMIGSRPMATLIIPNNGAQNVNPESSIFISFNKPVMRSSVTPSTVTVRDGDGKPVSGQLEFRTQLSPLFRSTTPYATFAPLSKLLPGETYTLTLRGGIIDSNGNNIYPRAISFTTAGAAGQPAPGGAGASTVSVLRTNPTDGMTGVATDLTIRAQFSAPIMGSTVSTNTFKVTGENGQTVPGNVLLPAGPSASVIAYDPQAALAPGKYNVEITSGITDMQGIPVMNKKWSFTTAGAAGQVPTQGQQAPTPGQSGDAAKVLATQPADRAKDIARNTFITARLSKALDTSTLTTSTFMVFDEKGVRVPGTVFAQQSGPNTIAVFDPSTQLKSGERYRVQLSVGAKDTSGIAILPKLWSFTTD